LWEIEFRAIGGFVGKIDGINRMGGFRKMGSR
jgi:hypothetical protein